MRSRNLKPGFFKSEELAAHPPLSRILFEGLWCLADCKGRLEDRPKYIKAEVLPYDDYDVDAAMNQLGREREFGKQPFLIRYRVGERRYIWIPGFNEHQRITGKEAEKDSLIPEYDPSVAPGNIGETSGKQLDINESGSSLSSCAHALLSPCTSVPPDPCTLAPLHPSIEIPVSYPSGTLAPSPRKAKAPKHDKFRLDTESWEWVNITPDLRSAWAVDYPGINIEDELRKARAWVRADPTRKKTNWTRFIAGWFSRAQDKCHGIGAAPAVTEPDRPNAPRREKEIERVIREMATRTLPPPGEVRTLPDGRKVYSPPRPPGVGVHGNGVVGNVPVDRESEERNG